jgi:hypothetical protein
VLDEVDVYRSARKDGRGQHSDELDKGEHMDFPVLRA